MSRLDDFDIRLASEGPAVSVYVRDQCIAAVAVAGAAAVVVPGAAAGEAPGVASGLNQPGLNQAELNQPELNQGSTGLMTEQGLAYLVWRDGLAFLAAKGVETPATPEQVAAIQKFSQDLSNALSNALSK